MPEHLSPSPPKRRDMPQGDRRVFGDTHAPNSVTNRADLLVAVHAARQRLGLDLSVTLHLGTIPAMHLLPIPYDPLRSLNTLVC